MPEELTTASAAAEEMDLTQYLPSLDGLQSGLTTWMKVLVMIGPIVMLLLGLYYFFLSPKEANHRAGYRFRYAMSKVAVWRFTQKLAGIAFFSLGLVLSIVMLCLIPGFKTMNTPDLVWYSVKCLMWQIILALIATVVVNGIVFFRYNYNGRPRGWKKKKKADPAAEANPATEAKPAAAPAKRPSSGSAAPAKRSSSRSTAPAKRPSSGSTAPAKRPSSRSTAPAKRPSSRSATPAKRPSSGSTAAPAKRPAMPPAAKPASSNGFQRPDDL